MPISKDNPIIKEIGKKLRKSLTQNEIAFLTQTLNEEEKLLFVWPGFFKKTYINPTASRYRVDVPIWVTNKYVALTNRQLIGFDDEQIVVEEAKKIELVELDSKYGRSSSLIYAENSDGAFFLFDVPEETTLDVFERLRTVLGFRYREFEMKDHVFLGTWNRNSVFKMILAEAELGENEFGEMDYEDDVFAYLNELHAAPKK